MSHKGTEGVALQSGELGGLTGDQAAAGVRARARAKLAVVRGSSSSASFALALARTPAAFGGQLARPSDVPVDK